VGETLEFLRYLAGRRGPRTSLTAAEQGLLRTLAARRQNVIEVGVYEGATSAVLAAAIDPAGRVLLVDPFEPALKIERLLRFSCPRLIARRAVRPWRRRVRFVRTRSVEAASLLGSERPAELIFIDADHRYEAVREDFLTWRALLAPGGRIAFHDSRPCPARPDLGPETGPVRLMEEIDAGALGDWHEVDGADSITVVASTAGAPEETG